MAAMAVGMAKPLIDERNRRSQAGKKAAESRWNECDSMRSDAMPMRSDAIRCDADAIECDADAIRCHEVESRKKKVESNKCIGRFTPPTPTEVQAYVAEKGYAIDAFKFCDFYESKGWYVGKNKMKDWKAAVRNWARSQRKESTANGSKSTNRFNNFEASGTDWDAVADMIMEMGDGT